MSKGHLKPYSKKILLLQEISIFFLIYFVMECCVTTLNSDFYFINISPYREIFLFIALPCLITSPSGEGSNKGWEVRIKN